MFARTQDKTKYLLRSTGRCEQLYAPGFRHLRLLLPTAPPERVLKSESAQPPAANRIPSCSASILYSPRYSAPPETA